ncbi:MAG: DUF1385 domain-containing protein [Deltaproteobacteria bacterium]|nr:DUF1385 domain-containing protein [Deltaproteobacteria bacterium]
MSAELKSKVGGQAVLEGVMMRSPRCFAVVVRRQSGALVVREQPWKAVWTSKIAKVPFLRGAATLVESMSNGYQALSFSAEQMEEDLAAEAAAVSTDGAASADSAEREAVSHTDAALNDGSEQESTTPVRKESSASALAGRMATVFAVLLFIALPQVMAWLVGRLFGPGLGLQDFAFHAITGAFKLLLVVGYMLAIRRVPEVRRVFQYHGAEHKAIATFEGGDPLEVSFARGYSTRHARCGTTFIMVVVMVSVLAYAAILPPLLKGFDGVQAQVMAVLLKVLMLPLIAGVAYELQRIGARFTDNPIAKIFLGPGYLVQGITTIEPTDDQLEVALASLRVTLAREAAEQAGASSPVTKPIVRRYASFEQFTSQFAIAGFKG